MIFAPIALVLVLFKRSPLRLQHAKNMLCPCLRMNPKFAIRGIVSDSDADATVEILSDPPPNLGLTIGRADEGGPCFIKAITPDSPLLGILVTNDILTSVNDADARALDPSQIEAQLASDCLLSVAMAPMRGKAMVETTHPWHTKNNAPVGTGLRSNHDVGVLLALPVLGCVGSWL